MDLICSSGQLRDMSGSRAGKGKNVDSTPRGLTPKPLHFLLQHWFFKLLLKKDFF